MSDETHHDEGPDGPEDRARRRLLKLAIYIPPAVVGTIVLGGSGCQSTTCPPFFCAPNTCGPNACDPNQPCSPNGCAPSNP